MQAMKDELDVFHTPCFSLPVVLKFPRVITIHDLIILKRPTYMSGLSRYYFGKFIPWTAKYADHVITNSESTKRDVVKYLGIPQSKVSALLLAPTFRRDEIVPPDVVNRFRSKYKLHNPYVLFVGSLEYRKNIESLISQFARVQQEYPDYRLVLAGSENAYQEKLKQKARKSNVLDKTIFTGYLNRKELLTAYRESSMVVMPSFDEGFGLPIVEAMEMGKPVVASRIPAHIESAGGAAAMFDTNAERQLGDEMLKIISDEEYRRLLVEKGLGRAKQLSWNTHARKTVEIYYKIVRVAREKRGLKMKTKGPAQS
jgi:glycosyltransferase involved in cell wall biosynthesis